MHICMHIHIHIHIHTHTHTHVHIHAQALPNTLQTLQAYLTVMNGGSGLACDFRQAQLAFLNVCWLRSKQFGLQQKLTTVRWLLPSHLIGYARHWPYVCRPINMAPCHTWKRDRTGQLMKSRIVKTTGQIS